MPRPIDNLESAFTEMYEFITDLPSGLDGFESDFDEAFKELENLKVAIAQPGKPLTLNQLRKMDGQPVWCEDVERWALVSVSDAGKWKGVPFALFEKNGARFEWNIEDREMSLYSYPPDQQQWIPVSERLPDPLEDVLVKCKTSMGGSYECIAQYIAPGTAEDETDVEWDWEVLDYNEKRDVYVVQPGWYESVKNWDEYGLCGILDIVTHWMPLPEPPEEG